MRMNRMVWLVGCMLTITGCVLRGPNPDDPYEAINRKMYSFNTGVDRFILKPPAKVYVAVVPAPVRAGVNRVYNNINMLPTVANDILQADFNSAIKDSWRFFINSTFGIGGIFDAADKCQLPPHSNDLGLTFAKWGDKHSPYVVIPFLGPSTVRDGVAMIFDYVLFTPYPYIRSNPILYSVLALRYVDLRSQMLDSERLINEAMDKYSFIRDAYLQHRNYLINNTRSNDNEGALYVEETQAHTPVTKAPLTDEPEEPQKSLFPITTANNDTHSSAAS